MANETYTIHQLIAQSGASVRALRHWTRLKLIPKPIGRGRGARYDDRHLIRAKYIQHLRNARQPLRSIRTAISGKSDEQLLALLPRQPRAVTPEGVPIPPPAPTYPSAMWEVVELMDGLFLFVNPAKGAVLRRVADDIYRHYTMAR